MTEPLASTRSLLALLELVDISRARATFAEDQYRAEIDAVYADRATALRGEQQGSEEDGSPILTAALLAAVVVILRRALSSGSEEGARFAQEQFEALDIPAELLDEIDLSLADLGDRLIKDFLAGQTDVARAGGKPAAEVLEELRRRAQLAALSALHVARGAATDKMLSAGAELINNVVHKLWVARFDLVNQPCKLCVRLHGQYVPVGQAFAVPKAEPAPYQGALNAPPRHPHCRCSLVLYLPGMLADSADDVTPLSMQAYASWALGMSDEDRSDYLAATVVRVRAYTRVVNGKIQHVSGYYYDIQTGQKIPEGQWGNVGPVKEVSAKQAKAMAKVSKSANAATPKGGAPDLKWKPGTYRIDLPNSQDDVQVIVHQDGSSTSIYKGKTEDADPAKTAQFLSLHKQNGSVQKISDDPEVHDPDGPGPALEPDAELKKKSTLAEGWYLLPKHKTYGGVRVDADGSGKLYSKDFSKTIHLKETAINQISNGYLGEFEEVDEKDFKSDWDKEFEKSKAGGAKPSTSDAGAPGKSLGSVDTSKMKEELAAQKAGAAPKSLDEALKEVAKPANAGNAPGDSVSSADQQDVPEAPEGGPGGVVKGGPSLFSVGKHSVQIEEGAQVYKSGKSKDTLYVLQPDGDLIKYNPQGAGVQATKVGSSENPTARVQLLVGLSNVTDEGVSIKDSSPLPGTGKVLVGGFEMTSAQLGSAIAALSANPSGNVAADLKKIGSPLAAGKFHEVAAPLKAYFNNKTKPALIAALKKAQQQAGTTPLSEAPAVAHLEQEHGLSEHHAQLGHNDHEAIHQALHAVDLKGSGHTHAPAAPGFISFGGVPVTPQAVTEAIDALQKTPKAETGIKKPLKATGSPLAGVDLQELVNSSSVTDQYKGSNGKVHYGKIKPAVITLLQDAIDKHQTDNPPQAGATPPPPPPALKSVDGVLATDAQILEMQGFWAGLDLDADSSVADDALPQMAHNPLAFGVDWQSLVEAKHGDEVPDHLLNQLLHEALNDFLDKPTTISQVPPKIEVPEDTSPEVKIGAITSTVDQLKQLKSAVDAAPAINFGALHLPTSNAFDGKSAEDLFLDLDLPGSALGPELKQAISDAVQKKIDKAVLQHNLPPISAVPIAPSTISVGGKSVTKQDLLAAVVAVKASPATGVKGPLKEIDSPLAKVDIKAYVEADPLSAPYKGSNGKVHYSKLKDAVAAVLQGKADQMGSATPEITHADATPDVTEALDGAATFFDAPPVTEIDGSPDAKLKKLIEKAQSGVSPTPGQTFAEAFHAAVNTDTVHYADVNPDDPSFSPYFSSVDGSPHYRFLPNGSVFSVDDEGNEKKLDPANIVAKLEGGFEPGDDLETAIDEASSLPDPGFYSSPGGMSLKVFGDGTAQVINNHTGQVVPFNDSADVKALLDAGTWDKLSDTPIDPNAVYVNGVESGFYAGGPGSASFSVYPDGSVFVEGPSGDSLMSVDVAKPYLQAEGLAPTALKTDPHGWMLEAKKDPNGFLVGKYDLGGGEHVNVTESGPQEVSPQVLAQYLLNNDAAYVPSSVLPGDETDELSSAFAALLQKAKTASWQDPWATTTTTVSQGFQKAVVFNEPIYKTGSKAGDGWSTGAPPQVDHYKFTPDGKVQKLSANGSVLKDYSQADLVALLDGAYDGPSVAEPVPLPPEEANEVWPDGTWKGNPVGTWTTHDGGHIEIDADGPDLAVLDDYGMSEADVSDMIAAGDLTWIPPQDSPVESTPSSLFDADAPTLQPFMTYGYTKPHWLQKPELLAAAQKWAKESGFEGVAAQHLSTANKDDLLKWLDHWSKGEWDKAYAIEAQKVKKHKGSKSHPGSPDNPVNANGFTQKKMPPLVAGEVPAGSPVSVQMGSNYYAWDEEQVDAFLVAANMQNPTGLTKWSKKDWVQAHVSGNKIAVDSLSALAQKNVGDGQILSDPVLPPVPKYAPGQAVPLPADFPEIDFSKSSAIGWTNNQLDQYLNHVAPTKKDFTFLAKQSPETKAALVQLHAVAAAPPGVTTFKDPGLAKQQIKDLLDKVESVAHWNESEVTDFIKSITKVDGKTFTKDKVQPPLKGHSTIYHVTDEKGVPHLFKVAPEKFRAEIEHAAHELAQLSGIKVADSILGTFGGQFGQFQAKIPSKSTLYGVPASSLPLSAMKDLLRAHVQDWVTSNDDAHDDNFLLTPDGKNVVPIDIARAFVRFGQPGAVSLQLGKLSNWETPYYQKVYDHLLSGKLSDADVDELYRASVQQARKTQAVSDAAWSDVLDRGLKNRPNYGWTSASNRAELIEQALARKNALEADFEKFWDGIYKQLGRDKPEAASALSKWTFSGVSPQLLEHAEKVGNHGAATFFGGTALEDGHLLAQVYKRADGKELHLSGQLRQQADADLRAWLAGNLSSDLSGATPSPAQKKLDFLQKVGASDFPSTIVSAAKTISHHHKQGDQNYNSSHMSKFDAMRADVTQKLQDVEHGIWPSSIKDWPEAQTEYLQLLHHYDAQLKSVQHLKDFNGQSKLGDFPEYSLTVPPEKALDSPIDLGDDLKVVKVSSYYDRASLDDEGNLVLQGMHDEAGQSGKTYQLTLSDGTQIEYKSWHPNDSSYVSQQGQLRIKVRDYDGTSAGFDSARAALGKMGLDLTEATEEDLELLYYRHLYGVLSDRKDGATGKFKEVVDDVKANLPGGSEGTPALEAKEELDRWRKAWSRLDPARFNTFLAEKQWMPRFSRVVPGGASLRGGQPYWQRFDYDPEWVKGLQFPTHSLSDNSHAVNLVKAGGLLSTEDRVKVLGRWVGGMSSGSDQAAGSANFVFVRLNQENGYAQVHLAPEVLTRTTNYAFNSDSYGKIALKKSSAYFDLNSATKHSSGSNETMIKHAVSLLDDIEMISFYNEEQRQEAITYLKGHGVTFIRGLPIEDRLVLQSNKDAALKKIRQHRETWKPEEDEL